jgi:uncharacterized protein (DUF2236 family)
MSHVTSLGEAPMLRRLASEPVLAFVLQRALVLEVAHPSIASGVDDHSAFRSLPLRRAWATLDTGARMVWGDEAVARSAAMQVHRFHDHVNGDGYSAHDKDLQLWVWATLVEAITYAHGRWIRPLSDEELDAFYDDMVGFAAFFGIPAELVPADRHAFEKYFESVLDGDTLAPTPTSSMLVRQVLWFRHRTVPGPLVRPMRVLAMGTLDPRVRDRFGLRLTGADRTLFRVLDGLLRRTYRYRPAGVVQRMPHLYVSLRAATDRRVRAA